MFNVKRDSKNLFVGGFNKPAVTNPEINLVYVIEGFGGYQPN